MKKFRSLLKACLSSDMQLFKYNIKNKSKIVRILFPVFLALILAFAIGSYAVMFIKPLLEINCAYIVLSLFVFVTFLFTLMEGVYKSGDILFKSKDDDLLLSLPISKNMVMFVRLFKFYLFELLYNTLFLLPAMVVYAYYIPVGISYYITSLLMILLLPIIPIVISCILGIFTSSLSSRFKYKNLVQIIISFIFIGAIMVLSANMEAMISQFAEKASSINVVITKIYYPAGLYASLVTNFNIVKLLLFVIINIIIFALLILIFSNFYFKINTRSKSVSAHIHKTGNIKIKKRSVYGSLINKEFKKFFATPVLVINAVFGLILVVAFSIAIVFKFDGVVDSILKEDVPFTKDMIISYMPLVSYALILFGSFMSSLTNSLISLERKAFMILRSLPVKPIKIIMAKVFTALLIMLPLFIVSDLIIIIYFKFNILDILLIILATIIIPTVAETMGIIINLRHPKLDASNDTEIVKQSGSSLIAVMGGMVICSITIGLSAKLLIDGINMYIIMIGILVLFSLLLVGMYIYLLKRGTKDFNDITI